MTPEATSAALSEKERRRAEKERERREKEEREREKREKREREKEEKKEERRSRRLSMDAQSANVLKRRTVNLNSDEFSKDFAKFTEACVCRVVSCRVLCRVVLGLTPCRVSCVVSCCVCAQLWRCDEV
jgi:hypothetical protein